MVFMHSRFLGIALASALLVGCAIPVNDPPTGQPLRGATSAKVSFGVPASLTMRIHRSGYGVAPAITKADIANAQQKTRVLVDEVRKQVPAAIESALRSRGISAGDEAHVRVYVDDVSDDGGKESIRLTMYVYYRDDPGGITPWSVKMSGNTHMGTDAQTAAGRIAARAVELLVDHGLMPRSVR